MVITTQHEEKNKASNGNSLSQTVWSIKDNSSQLCVYIHFAAGATVKDFFFVTVI